MQKLLALVACLLISFPAFAQTVEQDGREDEYSTATERAQGVFLQYHMAVRAEESCQGKSFNGADWAQLEKITADKMIEVSPNIALGAARLLNLTHMADDDMDKLVSREGCKGQKVKEALQLYDDRLSSVSGQTSGTSAQPAMQATPTEAAPTDVAQPAAPATSDVQPEPLIATP